MPTKPSSNAFRFVRNALLFCLGTGLVLWTSIAATSTSIDELPSIPLVLTLAGFFGTIGWCILYLPGEVVKVEQTLLVLWILSAVFPFLLTVLTLSTP
jgi:hypothetical protein